jgi:hypothetical protein
VIGGIVLLGCCGVCGYGGYWFYGQIKAVTDTAEGFTAKLGSGDFTGAYNSMSANYRGKVSQEKFTELMKKAKMDQFQSVAWTNNSSSTTNGKGTGNLTGNVTLKDGSTTQITISLGFDGKAWTLDDVTFPGTPTNAPDEKAKPKDGKPKPKEEEQDK